LARRTLNLGILAHVDAGKTTLTERLLFETGVIDEIGSVDAGTTRTDSLELERRRGITIRSAVVSFVVGGVTVNLIDTPGHPDFIAEVERVLTVLDGAVLVVSAVEGVQPQTRVLMRALRRLGVPTLVFVNKIDRGGADCARVTAAVSRRLSPAIVPMGTVERQGTRSARFIPSARDDPAFRARVGEVLADQDEVLLAAYVEDDLGVPPGELAAQTRRARVHPVFFGSAITGAGITALLDGLVELLPTDAGDVEQPVSGSIFKVERGPAGEKVAYVRLFSGTLRPRDILHCGHIGRGGVDEKVTAISVFEGDSWTRGTRLRAGEIGKLSGLARARVGDAFGPPGTVGAVGEPVTHFPQPTMESVVVARRAADQGALRVALGQLAEQDPLINVRQDDRRGEISVSLYGEVQKEVIQATLANDFGLDVTFRATTTLCVERPTGTGEAVEVLNGHGNPFMATIGLRVEPAPPGSGIGFRLDVDARSVPTYVYKNVDLFSDAMGEYVRATLAEGLYGWPVTDCTVTMVRSNYSSADGPPSTRGPLSTAADFRRLTPMVMMRALQRAGTAVCEPTLRAHLEVPTATVGPVLGVLARLGASVRAPSPLGDLSTIDATVAAARVPDLVRQLPGLTGGEGVLETRFEGYVPVSGRPPTRSRTTADPLKVDEYLMYVRGKGVR
jgi:ribosomal protection tetracycline resistance protein